MKTYIFLKKIKTFNFKISLIFAFFVFFYLLAVIQLIKLQIINHSKYKKMANDQHWNEYTVESKRGNIFSAEGELLVGTEYNYLLFAEPNKITDKSEFANALSNVIYEHIYNGTNVSQSDLYNKYYNLINNDLMWVGLEKNITPLEKDKIDDLDLEFIGFEPTPIRYYPENKLASHVLGFVASNDIGEKQGYFGIEGKFNEDLKGRSGRIIQEKDALGNPILAGEYNEYPAIPGRDIYLTINRSIQHLVEQKLKQGVEDYQAVSGSVIVMDPYTAEVIAMANYPTYHPSDFSTSINEYEQQNPYRKLIEKRNVSVSNTYEPGSVIKPFTVAAAIDMNIMTPETTFEDNGPVWYYEYKIDNWDGKHHGTQNLVELLQKSNNIGAAWVGQQVGRQNLHTYFKNFGIGTKTGIYLEGEDSGVMPNYDTWSDIGLANISFGQGMSATPLQVLNAFNSLINGGKLLEPKIVSKIVDVQNNKQVTIDTKVITQPITKETSDTMVEMLEKSASGGEAKYFVLKNYKIAGKTGTAQIPVEGTYDASKTNATFIGFLSGSKKFSMLVKLQEPQTSTYASETAVPLWMDIAEELINYYGIPADYDIEPVLGDSTDSNNNQSSEENSDVNAVENDNSEVSNTDESVVSNSNENTENNFVE